MRVSAVIVAAGRGERFGAFKQVSPLLGIPVLEHTLARFQVHPSVDEIVVVLHPELMDQADQWTRTFSKIRIVVPGAETRSASVLRGIQESRGEWLLVHDGVRPLVSTSLIHRVVGALRHHPVVVPVVPLRDTVKRRSDDQVYGELDRKQWVMVQTPQGVHREVILRAYEVLGEKAWVQPDESTLVEQALGIRAHAVPGDPRNLKITYPEDLHMAEQILLQGIRVGFGTDLHRLVPGRPLVICGVTIPFEQGPLGHSDGDVGIHALIDALLGATALGDIGQWFPDTDPAYKDVASTDLLQSVYEAIQKKGFRILHVDLTIVLERPKIAPYADAMRAVLSDILKLSKARISIKAKTSEGVGPVGRGEAIQAFATVTLLGFDL